MRIGKLLTDASWGNSTDTVYQFCRQSVHQVTLLPSHGRCISAVAKPFAEWAKKPGDRVGPGWRIPGSRGQRPVWHSLYDSNFWKTFVHLRLGVAMGDPGSLSLWGREPRRHRMLAEHLTAETRERVTGTARTIDAWRLRRWLRGRGLDARRAPAEHGGDNRQGEAEAQAARPAARSEVTMAETKKKPEQQTHDRGLECRSCGCRHFYVVETRSTWGGRIRRVRECRNCGQRVTKY